MTDPKAAPDVWDGTLPPGGYVCAACGQPTESEPCPDHQPEPAAALLGVPAEVPGD